MAGCVRVRCPCILQHHGLAPAWPAPLPSARPLSARRRPQAALEQAPGEVSLLVGVARVREALGQAAEAEAGWRAVLAADASNVEAAASLAAQRGVCAEDEARRTGAKK